MARPLDFVRRLLRSVDDALARAQRSRSDAAERSASDGSSAWRVAAAEAEPGRVSGSGASRDARVREARRRAFLLSIDDAGEYLCMPSERIVLGHARGGRADLAFLADVGSEHAVLERRDSLRSGAVWSIAPALADGAGESVEHNGRAITERTVLAAGDRVVLARNLVFVFDWPDPASGTACLRFERGKDASGARAALLLADGPGGRVRIGASAQRHVRVANLPFEITLHLEAERLCIACDERIRSSGGGSAAAPESGGVSLPLPLARRIEFAIGPSVDGRPPFGVGIGPLDG